MDESHERKLLSKRCNIPESAGTTQDTQINAEQPKRSPNQSPRPADLQHADTPTANSSSGQEASALLLELVQGPMNQVSSLVVPRAEATVEEVSTEKLTWWVARTRRKRSSELHDSESSKETSDLVKLIDGKFQLLEAKVDKLQTDVSFMHSRSMQGTALLEPCIQVLFQTEPILLQLSLRLLLQYLMLRAVFTAGGRAGDHQTTQAKGK